jgi:lysyl-tRNA synthetase class 2
MVMTNSPSIQDVIFFPQMKAEKPVGQNSQKDFEALGVRSELIPILQKMGIQTTAQLKETKATKLFNDIGGIRKKMKLENVVNPTLQEIESWQK